MVGWKGMVNCWHASRSHGIPSCARPAMLRHASLPYHHATPRHATPPPLLPTPTTPPPRPSFISIAAISSATSALVFAASSLKYDNMFGEALDEAGFDDLDDSLNVFIALNACGLLLLTIGLAALRSQTGLAQWVGGLRVCDVKTGKPCGFGRGSSPTLSTASWMVSP